jgi:cyclopropane-fatty-acyl-phospholipid synthase
MVFGPNMIPVDQIDVNAPRDSDLYYVALMGRQFPGSFLPYGQKQIISTSPRFRLVSSTSGRLDYIETIRHWRTRSPHHAPERRCSSCSCFPAG